MSAPKKSPLRVMPIKDVTHKNFSDLIGIRGHRNYYVNLLSGKITFIQNGKKIATRENTIMAAKLKVEEIQKAADSGRSVERIRDERKGIRSPLIDDIWVELLKTQEAGKEEATKKNYAKSWRHGISFFWSKRTALEINNDNIEKYKREYLKLHPTRNFEQTFVHLNMLLNYSVKKGYIKLKPDLSVLKDVDEIIKKNVQYEAPGRVYTAEERVAMLKAADNLAVSGKVGGTSRPHKRMLAARARLGVLLGLVGLRKGEALKLKWDKMDFRRKIKNVWSYKNHKWREVPMTEDIVKALKAQREFTGHSEWVFSMPSDATKHISSQVFDKVWVRVKCDAKISGWDEEDKARFHDLRHTFATMTAELGWPPKVACDVLDMSMDMYDKVYAHPSGTKKIEWMNKTFDVRAK